jgi:HPt (histidine-containing phosphotransfer) domain-containing protein
MKYNVDLEKLADQFGFELDEVKMVVETFLETSKQNLDDMLEGIENNDKEMLSIAAHSLKGSSSTIQLKDISELAKEIELSAKNNKEIDYKKKYEELQKLISDLKIN